ALTVQYEVYCPASEVHGAKVAGPARGRKCFGHQLSHAQAMDLPREDQVGENPRWPPPRARKRDRPLDPEEAGAWKRRDAARKFPEDQRAQSIDWPRPRSEVQRFACSDSIGNRRTVYYRHHHRGCRKGDALEGRGACCGAREINRGNDSPSLKR